MSKIVLIVGLVGLCHAAYSATQHRSYMRLTEHEIDSSSSSSITSLPLDILIQTLVCLVLSCFGIIRISAKFKPIKITSEWENKTWDNIANRTSFYSFNHRGKYLFSNDQTQLFDKEPILDDYIKIEPKKSHRKDLTPTDSSASPTPEGSSDESDSYEKN